MSLFGMQVPLSLLGPEPCHPVFEREEWELFLAARDTWIRDMAARMPELAMDAIKKLWNRSEERQRWPRRMKASGRRPHPQSVRHPGWDAQAAEQVVIMSCRQTATHFSTSG